MNIINHPDTAGHHSRGIIRWRGTFLMVPAGEQRAGIGHINVLLSGRQYQKAVATCRTALLVAPRLPRLYLQLGMAMHRLGQMQQAAETCRQLLQQRLDNV